MAHPLPSDPVGQRGPVFKRKHSTSHIIHTHTHTIEGDSRSAEVGRKWRVPPPRGHILSLGRTSLFVQRSELFCERSSVHVETLMKPLNYPEMYRNSYKKSFHGERISLPSHSTCHWSSLHCNMWHSSANSTPNWFDKRPADRNTHSSPDTHKLPPHLPSPPMSSLVFLVTLSFPPPVIIFLSPVHPLLPTSCYYSPNPKCLFFCAVL